MYILSLQKVIINLSEESQLEAAIKASLEESVPDNHTLTFSDDSDTDYLSLSPLNNKHHTGVQSIGKSSRHPEGVSNDNRTGVVMVEAAQERNGVNNCKSRKRPSNGDDDTELRRKKKMRSDLDPVCAGIDSMELTRGRDGGDSGGDKLVNGKGRKGKGSKGKGKAKRSRVPCASVPDESGGDDAETRRTVEELLASGDVHKDQVTQILFRLPDGTRLQKSFLCTHPVEVCLIP